MSSTDGQQDEPQPEADETNAAVASHDDEEDLATPVEPESPALSRRRLFAGAGIATAVVAGGGLAAWLTARRTPGAGNVNRTLKIGYGGGVCEGPLYVAHHQKIFEKHGLDVEIIKTGGDEIKDAVGAGKLDAAPGIFFSWLKPIEQGIDAKLAAGLHEGCLRLVVTKDSPLTSVAELRGKPIGVGAIGDSAMSFFSLDLLDAGLHPSEDVDWRVFPADQLADALTRGDVAAIAASDPNGLLPTLKGKARELTNNQQGANRQLYCCATAINGRLLREDPDVARSLVTAWAEGSRWVGANIAQTAALEVEHKYVAAEQPVVEAILNTYGYNPSAIRLKDEITPGIAKFARTGYLDRKTDPNALADKVYADLALTW
ncbi:ABC transporter substrate-binding protein [Nocardia bovistercoris]|uniref:ABC transporter substrate-binding protein n=1 Tax=Nocardia bovistercoris TaxID=2785916 RepID=A0A931N3G7_9NOCA|nr:ABC transporter substrate-binding protein [Nocardia bovistercoris]MBH0777141.1 ABC transporter substrate-binding protein [Nocardia bovistercoris]